MLFVNSDVALSTPGVALTLPPYLLSLCLLFTLDLALLALLLRSPALARAILTILRAASILASFCAALPLFS